MKTFAEILNESKATYSFNIAIAGELPEGIEDRLESVMQKFTVRNFTKGKKTPIQKRPLDFPQLENTEVTFFEAEVEYPTTPQVLQTYLGNCCDIPQSHINVRTPEDPREAYQEEGEENSSEYVALLGTEDMGGESAQNEVADNRTMDLLKELETARKERDVSDGVAEAPQGDSKDIKGHMQNTKAVVGG
ncbi:MAG: hypothetical protein CMG35_05255 [Candidatus Marinimicrobia bacterium]|nr:hypothetical protein [Candidatus Neomarinimicrobiota bacterium]